MDAVRSLSVKLFRCLRELNLERGDRLYTSKSDVCRRQILTSNVDASTESIELFIMAVDP